MKKLNLLILVGLLSLPIDIHSGPKKDKIKTFLKSKKGKLLMSGVACFSGIGIGGGLVYYCWCTKSKHTSKENETASQSKEKPIKSSVWLTSDGFIGVNKNEAWVDKTLLFMRGEVEELLGNLHIYERTIEGMSKSEYRVCLYSIGSNRSILFSDFKTKYQVLLTHWINNNTGFNTSSVTLEFYNGAEIDCLEKKGYCRLKFNKKLR